MRGCDADMVPSFSWVWLCKSYIAGKTLVDIADAIISRAFPVRSSELHVCFSFGTDGFLRHVKSTIREHGASRCDGLV